MEKLYWFAERAGAALIVIVVLVGCAAPEPVVTVVEEHHARWVSVQSIPRGAWVEVDGGYKGVAPIMVEVETWSSGRPRRLVMIRATDMASGAWEEKRFYGAPMPDKVLFDLRPLMVPAGF